MRKHLFALLLAVFCVCYATAQTTVTGLVKDDTGEALPGASVKIKGTLKGTITDMNGKFSLVVQNPNSTILFFSYIGMKNFELALQGGKTKDLIVNLESNSNQLDDLVVIGYGTVRKRDLTGSVTSVGAETISKMPVSNIAEAITGRLTGVQVTTTDGSPDAEVVVRVRGGQSITGDNAPLYVVDGFPVSSISDIAPNDIQSFEVLKDASSTAIYGSQGSNGVVLITTKSAVAGKTTVSYNGYLQIKSLSKRLQVLDPYEYVKQNYEYAAINGSAALSDFYNTFGVFQDFDIYKSKAGHDWQNDLFGGQMLSYQHNINIQGGTEKTKFSAGATYVNNAGLMVGNVYTRLNSNFKINHEISKSLRVNFSGRFSDTEVDGSGTSGGTYKVRTSRTITRPPVVGLQEYNPVDPTTLDEVDYENWLQGHLTLAQLAAQYWRQKNDRIFNFSGGLEWNILPELTYRMDAGYEYSFDEYKNYYGQFTSQVRYGSDTNGLPYIEWNKGQSGKYRIANTLTYKKIISTHQKVDLMVGQEVISGQTGYNFITAKQFANSLAPEKIFPNIALGAGASSVTSFLYPQDNLESYFGRFNYILNDRYLLTLTMRTDGSSKFAPGKQWGYFPAGAFAWRIYEEPFMEGIKNALSISNLKLRLSYGASGNNRIANTMYKLDYALQTTKTYALGDAPNNYYAPTNTQMANPNLKWESTITKNVGLDFGLFNEKLTGTLEGYWNTTSDLLIERKIVAPGYSTVMENVGQISNKGIELTLNGNLIQHKDYSLQVNFNIAFNHSNVDKLADGINLQEYASGWAGTDLTNYYDYQVRVGQPVGLIMGYVTDGYYKTTDFTSYDPTTKKYILAAGVANNTIVGGKIGVRPGTIKFKDISGPNGVPDGVVDSYDQTTIGKTAPKFTGGFTINGSFHGFDVALLFNYVYGNQIYNADKVAMAQNYRSSDTYPNLIGFMSSGNRYTYIDATGNYVTDLPTLAAMNEGANAKQYWSPWSFSTTQVVAHSWAIEDGSYLRLQNVTVGYTIPKKTTRKFGCSQFRVYCTLSNVFLLTNYTGYDPEVSTAIRGTSASGLTPGCDYSSYPKSFGTTFGLNVTF